jgi:ATP-dependent DNA helicase DinG
VTDLSEFFAEQSPLKDLLPGFQPRPGQAWMAEAVAEAIACNGKLVVEAGTGTGKTFAYLLPALLGGRKTIISTGTKALQDQLYHRDLPLIGRAVGRPMTTALLKGRANYLCLHRLDQIDDIATSLAADYREVREWRHRSDSGDRAELTTVPEDSAIWPLVTSTSENCLGQKCPQYNDCHVVNARRAAQEADLVVVNHHLLLADLAMKEGGFVEFLPGAEAIILDEAHQVPDLAVQFFINALCAAAPRQEGRRQLDEVMPDMRAPFDGLRTAAAELREGVNAIGDGSPDIDKLTEQLLGLEERLALLASDDSWDGLRWIEVNPRSIRLNLTPLDVSETLSGMINGAQQAWVFTSATLAIGEDFSHFTSRMGLGNATGLTFPSPYALDENGLVYLPEGLPQPSDSGHTDAVMEAITPVLELTRGGVFFLFTSHRALNAAKKWFRHRKSVLGGRPLYTQGTAPRDDLLRRFRAAGNAVLLGTGSFWEGIDVRGTALTVVAIDKLPFTSPADPLLMARLEYIRRVGGNGFADHQLPQAALAMKQGAGRLLRDDADYGVIALCDPRITSRSYGSTFLKILEPMRTTRSLEDVRRFFERHECEGAVA